MGVVVPKRRWIILALACISLPAVAQASSPSCTISVAPTSGTAPLRVEASGNCTDQDNDLASVTLDWGDGSPSQSSNQGPISGSHIYNSAGKFRVSITGVDSQGGQGEAHDDVTVSAPPPQNQAPSCTLNVAPTSGPAPLNVLANVNCQDPDNNVNSITINWGDGSPPANGTSANLAAPHTYSQAGTFTVTATGTDAGGLSDTATKTVTVSTPPPSNQPPTCVLSVAPTSGSAPLAVTANGSCADPENRLASTSIDWGDGATTAGSSGNHTYSHAGNFQVVLTGRDAEGASGSASQRVNVNGAPPPPDNQAPSCSLDVTPAGGEAPVSATAIANCSDPDNDISGTVISFGDGFYQSGPTAQHIFPNGGTFTVSVTASDRAGHVSQPASRPVNVTEAPKLFVGVSNGQVKQFTRGGTPMGTLNTNLGGSITGMAIDSVDSLYVTGFTANMVSKFSGAGSLIGNFGSSYNCKPESIVFDKSGNAYVGQSDCSKSILKFDAYGNLFTGITVQTESTGSDAIELADDQCTLLYTSEGSSVLRFNACTGQQLQPFATGLQRALAIQVLSDGGAIVANQANIVRFDSAGRQIQSYDASGQDCWDALTLDRNPGTFWAADFCTSDIVHFEVGSGNAVAKFSSGTPANTVFGLAMKAAPKQTTAAGALIASPNNASISSGQSATFSIAFSPNKAAQGEQFSLACANLPVGASCSFSPPTFTANKDGNTATLTINTVVRSGSLLTTQNQLFYALLLPLLAMTASGFSARRRKAGSKARLSAAAVLLSFAMLFGLLSGCGGGADSGNLVTAPGGGGTAPAGTYTVIISADSGSLASSTSVTLSVH